MQDTPFQSEPSISGHNSTEPTGQLKRALYLWERQPPSEKKRIKAAALTTERIESDAEELSQPSQSPSVSGLSDAITDLVSDEWLRDLARRLAAIERIIPGDRRLDPPRFSLMMLNAFLGRAVTDGTNLANLPGLNAIRGRIEAELSDLEFEYPESRDQKMEEPDQFPFQIRDEIRAMFADIQSGHKAQQRQIVTSLTALHTAISELRTRIDDNWVEARSKFARQEHETSPPIQGLARPILDAGRVSDPRPILAAARAAAARSIAEDAARVSQIAAENTAPPTKPAERPYRSVLLGSAVLGFFLILFGREALQFFGASTLATGAVMRP